MNDIKISILLPTRGRTEQLDRSISSLIELADQPDSIQWLFGFDSDDKESYQYFVDNIQQKITDSKGTFTCLEFEPMGYGNLHEYVNTLAGRATGEWFVFWNDDAVMKSQGWDTEIFSHTGKFCLQAFETHNKHPYSIFPIVPKKWFELIGHLSKHNLNDAWLSQIAWMIDVMLRIPVEVEHERFDLTGKNKDATYDNRVIYEGNHLDPRDFNFKARRDQRIKEALKIIEYIRPLGYDLSHWDQSLQGKKDIWEKMLGSDVNKHMKKF